jgi:hypothetical protein
MGMDSHDGMISTRKTTDSSSRSLWQSYQQSNLVANKEELGEGNYEFGLRNIFVYTSKLFLTCKILRPGDDGLLPFRRKAWCGFISSLKIYGLGRVLTREPWVKWKAR